MKAVVAKVALGQADAGLVYITDVAPGENKVTVIGIPAVGQPRVRYEIAVVAREAPRRGAAPIVRTSRPSGQPRSKAGFGPAGP